MTVKSSISLTDDQFAFAKALVDAGADLFAKDLYTALHLAAWKGSSCSTS